MGPMYTETARISCGVRGVMISIVGNGHGDMISNPGRDLAFHIALISWENYDFIILFPDMGK